MNPNEVEVRLHGRRVGALTYEKGGSTFLYEDDLLSAEHQTLGQIFEESPGAPWRERIGLPAWFHEQLGTILRWVLRDLPNQHPHF